jgi:hypothetical protein
MFLPPGGAPPAHHRLSRLAEPLDPNPTGWPMPITRPQAREICTKDEFELVESSFTPRVKTLTPTRLRSKITRSRKLQDKFRELARTQNRATKGEGDRKVRDANVRTERKAQLFEETRERFEKRLAEVESKAGA